MPTAKVFVTLDMNGQRITNGADGVNPTDFATVEQLPAPFAVTDGSTTVTPATEIDFTSGATVTDGGGGIALVAVTGGGGGGFAAYGKRTTGSPISTSSTTFAGGVNLLGSNLSFVADGTSDYLVEVSAPAIQNSANGGETILNLVLDGSDAGSFYILVAANAGSQNQGPGLHSRGVLVAPSAGAHTVNIRLWVSAGTGLVQFGAGGAGNDAPLVVTIMAA